MGNYYLCDITYNRNKDLFVGRILFQGEIFCDVYNRTRHGCENRVRVVCDAMNSTLNADF